MKKASKKKFTTFIVSIILIILLAISLNQNRKYTKIEILFKDFSTILTNQFSYRKNNTSDQTESYVIQKNINTSLEKEIVELKELLALNNTLTSFEKENATVISRNAAYWFSTLTIDKGAKNGLKQGMAVLTSAGLVGKISKTTNTTSEVKLITTDDVTYKTSVVIRINEKDHYAILNGYSEEENYLVVSAIDKNTEIKKGDIVLTSGLGEMPRGIYIGTVEKTEIDSYNLSKIVYVTPSQDFSNIHYVTILKEKKQ